MTELFLLKVQWNPHEWSPFNNNPFPISVSFQCLQSAIYNIFDLSIVVTSKQQPLLCYPMGGCCREVALYIHIPSP